MISHNSVVWYSRTWLYRMLKNHHCLFTIYENRSRKHCSFGVGKTLFYLFFSDLLRFCHYSYLCLSHRWYHSSPLPRRTQSYSNSVSIYLLFLRNYRDTKLYASILRFGCFLDLPRSFQFATVLSLFSSQPSQFQCFSFYPDRFLR